MRSVTLKLFVLLFLGIVVYGSAQAEVKITGVSLKNRGASKSEVIIGFKGEFKSVPDLTIKNNMVQVAIPGATVWPKIEKKATVGEKFDTTLTAYQYNKKLVRVRTMLPYNLKGSEGLVSLLIEDGKIKLLLPRLNKKVKKIKKVVATSIKEKVVREAYDESYLDRLIKNKQGVKNQVTAVTKKEKKADLDVVTRKDAAVKKEAKKFSITSYIGKFVAFLGVILLGFYVVVTVMRKGVLKKGKLGFLNSTKIVEVLNTTYVAPKKSLMMVKAHNQVFLISNTEKGMSLISEIDDVTGLIKSGEKEIAGNNFDSDVSLSEFEGKEFKLKEDVPKNNLEDFLEKEPVEEKVRLSDQIKNKVKNLKQLQQ